MTRRKRKAHRHPNSMKNLEIGWDPPIGDKVCAVDGCGWNLRWNNKSGKCKKHLQLVGRCKEDGCTVWHYQKNVSGYCADHAKMRGVGRVEVGKRNSGRFFRRLTESLGDTEKDCAAR